MYIYGWLNKLVGKIGLFYNEQLNKLKRVLDE